MFQTLPKILALVMVLVFHGKVSAQIYELQGKGDVDIATYISLNLSDVLGNSRHRQLSNEATADAPIMFLQEFTMCVDFSVTIFTRMPAIIGYAVTESRSGLDLFAEPERILVVFRGKWLPVEMRIHPFSWYHVCIMSDANTTYIYLGDQLIGQRLSENARLPLDGYLVLGQDQDQYNKFAYGQSFRGRLSQFSLWSRKLSIEELNNRTNCNSSIPGGDIIQWDTAPWEINGNVALVNETYCNVINYPIYLFQISMTLESAKSLLNKYGMLLAVPCDMQELNYFLALLVSSDRQCSDYYRNVMNAWIAVRDYSYNHSKCINTSHSTGILFENNTTESQPLYPAILSTSGSIKLTNSSYKQYCFIGRYPANRTFFKLRGLREKDIDGKDLQFVFSTSTEGDIFLAGLRGLKIHKVNSEWQIYDYIRDTLLATTHATHVPLGRRFWKFIDSQVSLSPDPSNGSMLVLSSCGEERFTCNDGTCVNMSFRCDLKPDCLDYSDEQNCEIFQTPQGYIKQLPPKLPMSISLSTEILDLNVDIQDMTIFSDLRTQFTWYDNHISFKNLREDKQSNVIWQTKDKEWPIWIPKYSFYPTISSGELVDEPLVSVAKTNEGRSNGDDVIYDGNISPVTLIERRQPTIRCTMCLKHYPHDRQICAFQVYIRNVPSASINLSDFSLEFKGNTELNDYDVSELQFDVSNNSVNISIQLKRIPVHEISATYFPTLVLILIAYGTLHIPLQNFSDRGTMSLTSLLVLIALYTESLSNRPSTPYITNIDLWYMFIITYMSLIILLHLATREDANAKIPSNHGIHFTSNIPVKNYNQGVSSFLPKEWIHRGTKIMFAVALIVFLVVYIAQIVHNQVQNSYDQC